MSCNRSAKQAAGTLQSAGCCTPAQTEMVWGRGFQGERDPSKQGVVAQQCAKCGQRYQSSRNHFCSAGSATIALAKIRGQLRARGIGTHPDDTELFDLYAEASENRGYVNLKHPDYGREKTVPFDEVPDMIAKGWHGQSWGGFRGAKIYRATLPFKKGRIATIYPPQSLGMKDFDDEVAQFMAMNPDVARRVQRLDRVEARRRGA